MGERDRGVAFHDLPQPGPDSLKARFVSPLTLIMDAALLEAQADQLIENSEKTLFRRGVTQEVNLLRLGATAKRVTAKLLK